MNRKVKYQAWIPARGIMLQVNRMALDSDGNVLHVIQDDPEEHARNLGAHAQYLKIILREFTGLHDKNGREIYEGDIVRYGWFAYNDTQTYGEEPWNNLPQGISEDLITRIIEPAYVVKWTWRELENLRQMVEGNPDVFGVEVIGSIYENPELLN